METVRHWLITWHETDGNDCTVFDTYVAAETEESALDVLSDALATACPSAQEGCDFVDFTFSCDCGEENAEHCDGHGGTALREIREFPSMQAACDARPFYHSCYEIPT